MRCSAGITLTKVTQLRTMLTHLNKANLKRQSQVRAAKLENSVKMCSTSKVTGELHNKEGLFLTLSDWQKSKCDTLHSWQARRGKPEAGCRRAHGCPTEGCVFSHTHFGCSHLFIHKHTGRKGPEECLTSSEKVSAYRE